MYTEKFISIHAPREGCDFIISNNKYISTNNFNPRTPRGVRLVQNFEKFASYFISIHAPREGCDVCVTLCKYVQARFQSTHPARGATLSSIKTNPLRWDFNPRTPRGVRLQLPALKVLVHDFNPRTPRGVRRFIFWVKFIFYIKFQSTHPARGATRRRRAPREEEGISIHAPREGCDGRLWYTIDVVEGFQSTHPARGATISMYGHGGMWIFQSTHPARGATG